MKILKFLMLAFTLNLFATAHASVMINGFECPKPSDVFTIPLAPPDVIDMAMWLAPQLPTSEGVGDGFGGNKVGELYGASSATVNDKPGWACYYVSKHAAVSEFKKHSDKIPTRARGLLKDLEEQSTDIGAVFYQLKQ